MNITIDIKQLKDLEKRLLNAGPKTIKAAQYEVEASASKVLEVAKQLVPVDFGLLKGSIASEPLTKDKWKIGANREYAPYVEFGTGARVNVSQDWEAFALQFKDPSSEFAGLRNGQHAQPYLYPGFKAGKKELIDRLENVIKEFNLQ